MNTEIPVESQDLIRRRIEEISGRYPERMAATLPALHIVQETLDYIPDAGMEIVAEVLGVPLGHVHGVVTFYTMYRRKKLGVHHLEVCTNVSCMIKGAYRVLSAIEDELGISAGEISDDGQFSLAEVECLAACGTAPVVQVGDLYHEGMTPDSVKALIRELRSAKVRGATPKAAVTPAEKPSAPSPSTSAKAAQITPPAPSAKPATPPAPLKPPAPPPPPPLPGAAAGEQKKDEG